METDDDPVTDAIRAVIDGDTDEEVVYPRSVGVLCPPEVSNNNLEMLGHHPQLSLRVICPGWYLTISPHLA